MRLHAKVLFAVAALASFLVLAPSAMAVKTVDRYVGFGAGGLGGEFNSPADIAVNEAGVGGAAAGDVYVADRNNNRIAVYSSAGVFKFAFGRDVIAAGKAGDSGEGFEKCAVAADCKSGSQGVLGGEFRNPQGIAVDQASGDVYVRDIANNGTAVNSNLRVQQFSATGAFIRAFGFDVVQTGGTGDTDPTNGFEICTVASQCKEGSAGAGNGQFDANGTQGTGIAVAPAGSPSAGHVFVTDPANRRIQEFDPSLAPASLHVRSFGEAGTGKGQFNNNMPQHVAVDSMGVVYGSDTSGNGRINRFDAAAVAMDPIAVPPLLSGGTNTTSSSGLEVDPDSDGAGADVDRLYVARNPSSGNTVVQQLDNPGEAVPPAAVAATHGPTEFGTLSVNGLGINTTLGPTGTLYVSTNSGSACGGSCHGVFALDDDGAGTAIDATIASASSVTATSATLNGAVDPDDGAVAYHFEYSPDGIAWTSLPNVQLSGTGSQPVSQNATGLNPNTTYQVRLAVTKVLGLSNAILKTSPETQLLTDPAQPSVATRPAHAYDDTSAWLVADVNPNSQSTSYHFEWGSSTSYGNSLPITPASAGSGGETKSVLEKLSGLAPNTTYHYRVVATNATGTATGADVAFTTRAAFAGFPKRAYEQVSPVDKLNDIGLRDNNPLPSSPTAADGETKAFQTIGSLGGSDWGQDISENVGLARRTPTGWVTDPIEPKRAFASNSPAEINGIGGVDLSRQVVTAWTPLTVGPAGYYLQDSNANTLDLLAEANPFGGQMGWGSSDLSHVAFFSSDLLTGDPGIPDGFKAYEWHDGELRLVAIEPGGATPFPGPSRVGSGFASDSSVRNAVSADGEHIFFTTPQPSSAPEPTSNIYRRDHGAETVLVSPSKRTTLDPLGPQGKRYLDATADQSTSGPAAVFFTSEEKLTNDATNNNPNGNALGDLYRYEVNTDTLTNISAETNDPNGAEVEGLVGTSEDGSWVYYVARGQVVVGKGMTGKPNLYMWHDDGSPSGVTRFLTTLANFDCKPSPLAPGDSSSPAKFVIGDGCNFTTDGGGNWEQHSARVTSDGQTLLFQSAAPLTGYPNQGHNELYLYEADANGGAGALTCVSCNPTGSAASEDALLSTTSEIGAIAQDLSRNLSADGNRVFFNTVEALVPEDVNGQLDIYVWEAGHIELISSGHSDQRSFFDGASADGDDVFFNTREKLVGQDTDGGLYDTYDYRVGGGIAAQNPPPPGVPCVGNECKPPATPTPGSVTPQSSGVKGAGNYVVPFEVANLNIKQRRAFSASGKVLVRVRVKEPGRILIRALKGKKVLGTASKRALKPSTVQVPLKLRPFALRTLRKEGQLRVTLEVRFGQEVERLGLRLRRAK